MQTYGNGDSGVTAYEAGDSWIVVQFGDGHRYRYDATAPGPVHVAAMIDLASAGRGLNTYINQHVRANFARKVA